MGRTEIPYNITLEEKTSTWDGGIGSDTGFCLKINVPAEHTNEKVTGRNTLYSLKSLMNNYYNAKKLRKILLIYTFMTFKLP